MSKQLCLGQFVIDLFNVKVIANRNLLYWLNSSHIMPQSYTIFTNVQHGNCHLDLGCIYLQKYFQ